MSGMVRPPQLAGLTYLQEKTQIWRENSFPPEDRTAPLQALGVAEEYFELGLACGRLSHATLKMKQGIRGSKAEHVAAAEDAIGDMAIYLMGVCSSLDLDFATCILKAWDEVQQRDWSKNKQDGIANPEPSQAVGPICSECGGLMKLTKAHHTCTMCGHNDGRG